MRKAFRVAPATSHIIHAPCATVGKRYQSASQMVELTVDGMEVSVPAGTTILQVSFF